MAAIPPSGRQFVISHDRQEAVVTEVGAGLRSYRIGDVDILDGYAEDEMCTVARGAPLIPWPNRLAEGRYEFMGVSYQTAITEPAQNNAIHGLTRWMNWEGEQTSGNEVRMSLLLHPQEGYPFTLALAIHYRLDERGLSVRTTATNAGAQPLPYGAGQHPYLTLGTDRVDAITLRLPALLSMEVDARQIPTGRLIQVKETEFDFLDPRPIGSTRLDTAFTSLVPDTDGLTRIVLTSGERRSTLWMDAAYSYVMVFTGDTIPQAGRRRKGLGLEPMTCAPNAFRSGAGLIRLAPGASATSAWGIFAVV
ncbi:MAG TPA: aldose 1-epimerase family protein [Candidatus Dormibacteraeota bacterium]|jgi:aldose 1-epimerase|nr:aldose 1-epimerase family protein [Candidatus Dormibacteraeota bacterium]